MELSEDVGSFIDSPLYLFDSNCLFLQLFVLRGVKIGNKSLSSIIQNEYQLASFEMIYHCCVDSKVAYNVCNVYVTLFVIFN